MKTSESIARTTWRYRPASQRLTSILIRAGLNVLGLAAGGAVLWAFAAAALAI